jgi:MFS transporter, SP family, arabinose:H+ symporter
MTSNKYLLTIISTVALGGFLFGFDTAVISGAIPFIKEHFQLDETLEGWAVGCVILGCMLGALTSGYFGDLFGRRQVLIVTGIMFIASALGTALTNNFTFFIIMRIIGGIGVGSASVLSPTYIAEISPSAIRGKMVSLNQLAIVSGILIVYFTNYMFLGVGEDNWRYMLASESLPALIFIIALFFIPESPRWLVKKNKEREAVAVLNKLYSTAESNLVLGQIKDSLKNVNRVKISELFEGRMKKILLIGTVLACLQQVTGINAVIYYAPTIFLKSGASLASSFWQPVMIGAINFIFTLVAISLIEKVGRKTLMLYGSAGMSVSLAFLVGAFFFDMLEGYWVLIFILGYIASFAASLAPVMWVVVSELFPNRLRGAAMSFSTFFHWTCTFLVVQTFPWLLAYMGGAFAFGIFAVLSVFTFFFIYKYVPETKGLTLESLEKKYVTSKAKTKYEHV